MKYKRLLHALEEMRDKAPHLMEQTVRVVTDEGVAYLILCNSYGDDRVFFVTDFDDEGDSDGRTVDATEVA